MVAQEAQHKTQTQTQGLVHRPQARSRELLEFILGRPYFQCTFAVAPSGQFEMHYGIFSPDNSHLMRADVQTY